MITLGIETSCDETAVALFDSTQGLLHEAVYSQIDLHADFSGVVPELAFSRSLSQIIRNTVDGHQ